MSEAYVTLATTDGYGVGALVLAHSLLSQGTTRHLVILVTPGVSQLVRDALAGVFTSVVMVDVLDSKDSAHLALLQRPELGVTFTKLHCWTLTQYTKCVFLDADILAFQNSDELFSQPELSAACDVGWPDCFNSGMFVFTPSEDTYKRLLEFAKTTGSFDGGDQGLLNSFFPSWNRLSFVYNMVASAAYTYLPAFKQFGKGVKLVHFLGATKPWHGEAAGSVTPGVSSYASFVQAWWTIYRKLVQPALPQEEGPPASSHPPQQQQQHHQHQQQSQEPVVYQPPEEYKGNTWDWSDSNERRPSTGQLEVIVYRTTEAVGADHTDWSMEAAPQFRAPESEAVGTSHTNWCMEATPQFRAPESEAVGTSHTDTAMEATPQFRTPESEAVGTSHTDTAMEATPHFRAPESEAVGTSHTDTAMEATPQFRAPESEAVGTSYTAMPMEDAPQSTAAMSEAKGTSHTGGIIVPPQSTAAMSAAKGTSHTGGIIVTPQSTAAMSAAKGTSHTSRTIKVTPQSTAPESKAVGVSRTVCSVEVGPQDTSSTSRSAPLETHDIPSLSKDSVADKKAPEAVKTDGSVFVKPIAVSSQSVSSSGTSVTSKASPAPEACTYSATGQPAVISERVTGSGVRPITLADHYRSRSLPLTAQPIPTMSAAKRGRGLSGRGAELAQHLSSLSLAEGQQRWEDGRPDYMGQDSFDNILAYIESKIKE